MTSHADEGRAKAHTATMTSFRLHLFVGLAGWAGVVGSLSMPCAHQQTPCATTRRSALATGAAALGAPSALVAFPAPAGAALAAPPDHRNATGGPAMQLASGQRFPLASFGLQAYDDERARQATLLALEVPRRRAMCARGVAATRPQTERSGIASEEEREVAVDSSIGEEGRWIHQ